MSKSVTTKIQPTLLVWARETAGYSIDAAAKKIHVSAEKLFACESGEQNLTFKQLQDAANVYKRPLALFFLPEAPALEASVQDFRLYREVANQPLAPAIHIEIRRARQHRDEAMELARVLESDLPPFSITATMQERPDDVAQKLSELLKLDDQKIASWKNQDDALKGRKAAAEAVGVLVFEASRIPTEQMRGVALPFDQLPVVILNGADSAAGRSFTLMHELTHLLLRQGGVCDLAATEENSPNARIEQFCNAVAAAVLMPTHKVLALVPNSAPQAWTMDQLGALAKPFRVSREALLVRLVNLGRATHQHYLAMRPLFREEYLTFRQSQKSKSDDGPSPAVMAVRNLGKPFIQLVLDAYAHDRIGLSTVSDYLGVKLKHLPKIRDMVPGKGVPA